MSDIPLIPGWLQNDPTKVVESTPGMAPTDDNRELANSRFFKGRFEMPLGGFIIV